jgi:hypothetical protein
MMEFSNSLKKRFVQDHGLPIQVVQEPMYSYYIEQLDTQYDTKNKLKMLTDVVSELGSEEAFFAESNKVKDTLIKQISDTEEYASLQLDRLDDRIVDNGVKQQSIYHMGNINRTFLSVDLKHANFNVLKMYDSRLVLGSDTYEEMIGSITTFDYFKKSKYLRQVIFGNVMPKKQQRLQKWVMSKVVDVLHRDVGIAMDDFVTSSSDEVVFNVDSKNVDMLVEMVNNKLTNNKLTEDIASWCNVDAFTLKSVGDQKFFVKENCLDDSVVFKGVQSYLFMQVFKKYFELPLTDHDMVFYYEGHLAEFKDPVFPEEEEE